MEDNKDENVLSLYEVVRDRNGKKHRVYSARFKDLYTITSFTEKYNADAFGDTQLHECIHGGHPCLHLLQK